MTDCQHDDGLRFSYRSLGTWDGVYSSCMAKCIGCGLLFHSWGWPQFDEFITINNRLIRDITLASFGIDRNTNWRESKGHWIADER